MKTLKPILLQTLHAIALALVTGLICTITDFIGTPVNTSKDILIAILHWGAVCLALTCLYYIILTLPKIPAAILSALIMGLGGVLAYYRAVWHYSLNTTMFDIMGATTSTGTMVTWLTYLWTFGAAAIGFLLVWFGKRLYTIHYKKWQTWTATTLWLILLILILNPDSQLSQPVRNRIPFNAAYVYIDYIENRQEIMTTRERYFTTAAEKQDSIITVVVIGEAVRADNLGINGYRRQTTPLLAARQNLIPLKAMWTDVTYTNGSVPRIMSRATEKHPERAYRERSFIDVFNAANQPSYVISNQNVEKQYAYFWAEADSLYMVNNSKNVYNFSKWLDGNILPTYNSLIEQMTEGLIVVHCIGSHWWYGAHYPENGDYYKPVAKSRIVTNCDSVEIINSYDNTIRYMDQIVNSMIERLEDKKAILIFVSDHGEALGENGMWLHASECKAMHRTGSFIWLSDSYKKAKPEFTTRLKNLSSRFLKTDSIYYWATENFEITY